MRNANLMLCVAAGLAACSSSPIDDPELTTSPFVVASFVGSSTAVEASYFSLPSGSLPSGASAIIRMVRSGTSVSVPMLDGGFDPVLLAAAPGDSVRVTVAQINSGAPSVSYLFTIPSKPTPPIVVRTDPAPHKRDVPLNATMRVVFSEPMDQLTLTTATVQVRTGSTVVGGQLSFVDASHLTAVFTPAAPLAASSDYELVVTQGVKDVTGDPLAAAVTVPFTTSAAVPEPQPQPKPVATVSLSPSGATLKPGATVSLSATTKDAAGNVLSGRVVTWQSSAAGVASVSTSGVVTAISPGSATITAVSEGVPGMAGITVVLEPVASVTVSPNSATIDPGAPLTFTATLKDAAGVVLTGRTVTWQSSAPNRATVTATGVVTGLSQGSTSITARSEGITGTANVTVSANSRYPVASVAFMWSPSIVAAGRTGYLQYIVRDVNGHIVTDRVVTYQTSDPNIVTTNPSGTYTGVAAGTATITATSEGKSGTMTVTVIGSSATEFIAAGGDFTCSLSYAGNASCWGNNSSGQLGNGSTAGSPVPVAVVGGLRFTSLSAGRAHACGITTTGAGYCWGDNATGQLGNGSYFNSSSPVAVVSIGQFSAISAGGGHSCGISLDKMYCWGDNSSGQLGNATTTSSNTPAVVALGFLSFNVLSAGGSHTCGIVYNPSVTTYCWGLNASGQLGVGTTTNSTIPVVVASGAYQFWTITAGRNHTCSDFFCWGENTSGQVGNGTTTNALLPVQHNAPMGYDETAVFSLGGSHSCAITSVSIYCWGNNTFGQLGTGSTASQSLPTAISGGSPRFVVMTAGDQHTCGRTDLGIVYCWGSNAFGQLGDGSYSGHTTPVRVAGQP